MNIEVMHSSIERNAPNICQIAAYRNGAKIYSDQWNGYKEDDTTHIMSATKSIMSLLIGIAVDHGFIRSIDDKILDYFPDYTIKRGEKTIQLVTIRHLLTMRAPYKCKGDPWTKVCSSNCWTKSSLDFLGGRKGLTSSPDGTYMLTDEFNYQTVCLHILSGLLYQVTKMTTVEYANRYLFAPLDIAKYETFYAKNAEEHKAFTLDKRPRKHIWFADPERLGTPGYGLCMSADDMAKIGLMCLNKGIYKGKLIVSSKWIEEMTIPKNVETGNFGGLKYGYLWWIIHPEDNIYAAIGNSGNVIYINPKENAVIAVASSFKPAVFDRVEYIENYILPNILK